MELDLQSALADAWNRVAEWIEAAIAALPNAVAALLVLVAFWFLARGVRALSARLFSRFSTYSAVNRLLSTFLSLSVVAVGILLALGILNLDRTVTSLLAGAGILGLAIGFAAQDTVENLIAGVMLSVRRPFKEGELVQTNDTFGVVDNVNLRSTIVRVATGQNVYIPNKQVLGAELTNYTERGERRVDLSCGVSYASDLAEVRRVALEAVGRLEGRDSSRDTEFYYVEFGGSSIDFVVRFWIPFTTRHGDYMAARSSAVEALKSAFDSHGITIPFPIRTLDFGIDVSGGVPLSDELRGSGVGRG